HTHEKERRFHIRSFENVQNLWRPPRIGTVVKGDRDLMLAAGTLMIKRREFCKSHIFRREIAIGVHSELSQSIGALLVNGNNLAIAYVGYGVRRFYQFEGLPCLVIDSARDRIPPGKLEVGRDIQRTPNRGVFAAEPINREPASLFITHFAQLIKKSHRVQEPDGVLLVLILKVKIRAV